ncbi:NAD(P)-binding domain-containing protein [Epidermidibacterium keratini]|uniref:NAD(P)-binding domain-containing protein n=1 Tax=Epidermidibacterium keratini TaxID=1891644 RepID=A0A7L4YKL2_9ACTN|nr:NAD(P)/FAD-dependent oxidoreductase [Epidermidibacterium keratini]QHB99607.1 NAD(P)-binding domain-containing protein [Epidermidibacterium keratini]
MTTTQTSPAQQESTRAQTDYDAVIIGAGFSGMYQLHKLRGQGISAHVYEAGDDVGGTWYWNRYPGARCDIESVHYSFSFDEDLQQEWNWSERYAAQPELLTYAQHIAERYDLRRDITFGTRVEGMDWDEDDAVWTVRLSDGSEVRSRFVIAATGTLSKPQRPAFDGLEDFEGELYYTSSFPHEGVDLSGKRVAVVGTGSSGLQTITAIAPEVGTLTVFQRTPSFAVPAHNGPLPPELLGDVKARYDEIRAADRASRTGVDFEPRPELLEEVPPDDVRAEFDKRWDNGGLGFSSGFADVLINPVANDVAAEYVREKIRETVTDPEIAEKLSPRTYPIASKRMCIDTGYYETFNRDNVSLVDVHENPIERFTKKGIVAGGTEHEFDVVILATGFDAMTGALTSMNITAGDRSLSEEWVHGPHTYLGLMAEGFPNLFMITGPGSPSVLTNMITSIEYHVDWVSRALTDLRERDAQRIEPWPEAQDHWTHVVNDLGALTLMPQANSWYMGANIPGKERIFMPFVGGHAAYVQVAEGVVVAGYHGFEIS